MAAGIDKNSKFPPGKGTICIFCAATQMQRRRQTGCQATCGKAQELPAIKRMVHLGALPRLDCQMGILGTEFCPPDF
jgi:hypothetical protein